MYFLTPERVEIDARVLAITIAVTLTTGTLGGVIPAMRATRPALERWLRGAGQGTTSAPTAIRFIGGLAVVEVALALMLLTGASLMMRSS